MPKYNIVIIALMTLFFQTGCRAEVYVVDPSGEADFLSIQEAVRAGEVDDADTILVMPGEYEGGIRIDKSITLKAATKFAPTYIRVSQSSIADCEDCLPFGFTIAANGVTIEGFTFVLAKGTDMGRAIQGENIRDCRIISNTLNQGISGIILTNIDYSHILYNRIEGREWTQGVGSISLGSGGTLSGCNHNRIIGNVLRNRRGIFVAGSCNLIKSNIVENGSFGISISGGGGRWYDYNTVIHNRIVRNCIVGIYLGSDIPEDAFVFESHNQCFGNTILFNGSEQCLDSDDPCEDRTFIDCNYEVQNRGVQAGYWDSSGSGELPCNDYRPEFPYGNYWDYCLEELEEPPETFLSGRYLVYECPFELRLPRYTTYDNYPLVDDPNPVFIRGDANNDRRIDLGDAIFILSYLFGHGTTPLHTLDALDVNDDGSLNISDAIYLLSHLFIDAESYPISFPYPQDGLDP